MSIQKIAECALDSYSKKTWDLGLDTEVLVTYQDDFAIVAIRGTEGELADIKTDLSTYWSDLHLYDRTVMAHHGFLQVARLVAAKLMKEIVKPGSALGGLPITLTGHSLGGAAATLTAAIMRAEGFHVPRVVTFGSPRPGDSALRDWLESNGTEFIRVVNAMDGVTAIPFLLWGYRHVGELLYLNSEGAYRSPSIWQRILLRTKARKGLVGAHSMKLYLERVTNEL